MTGGSFRGRGRVAENDGRSDVRVGQEGVVARGVAEERILDILENGKGTVSLCGSGHKCTHNKQNNVDDVRERHNTMRGTV